MGSIPESRRFPWRRKWQSSPIFLSGETHRQRRLKDDSPWGRKRVRCDLATKQPPPHNCTSCFLPFLTSSRVHACLDITLKPLFSSGWSWLVLLLLCCLWSRTVWGRIKDWTREFSVCSHNGGFGGSSVLGCPCLFPHYLHLIGTQPTCFLRGFWWLYAKIYLFLYLFLANKNCIYLGYIACFDKGIHCKMIP